MKANLKLTSVMKENVDCDKVVHIVKKALEYFPEFNGKEITVGNNSNGGGSASLAILKINLCSENLTMFVVGHELTHLLQGRIMGMTVPYGEVTCDIWTITRNDVFLDRPPSYLNIPDYMRDNWGEWKLFIRKKCIEAIKEFGDSLKYINFQRILTDKIRDDAVEKLRREYEDILRVPKNEKEERNENR